MDGLERGEGGERRRFTMAKLNDRPAGEEQPRVCQSEILDPAIPTMIIAKRIWRKRRPQRYLFVRSAGFGAFSVTGADVVLGSV